MRRIALEMLFGDRLKYLGLVVGLSFASLLITQQAAIYHGYTHRIGAWIRDTGGVDLWVMDEQVDYTEDRKPLPDTALQRARSVEGVAWAMPMWKGYLGARLADGTRLLVRIVGLDDATLVGGPPQVVEGRLSDLRQDRAVMMDFDSLGDLRLSKGTAGEGPRPLRVGDHLAINDHDVMIVGGYRRSPEFFWDPVLYTTYSRALELAPPQLRQLSFVLVKVRPGADVAAVQRRIREATGFDARTSEEFVASSERYVLAKTGIRTNFGITIALGFVIGALVSGQMLYNFVLENLRYYAAMKAMGATNGRLVRMVALQVLTVALLGIGIGTGGASASGELLRAGGLAFGMVWQIPVFGAAAVLLACFLAALVSIRSVLRLEPAAVFKA